MIVARGITRTVLLTRRYAVKLPSLRAYDNGIRGLLWSVCRGILANQCEAEWWESATPAARRALCPVLRSWLGGIVNVYPRCEPYEDDSHWARGTWQRPDGMADAGWPIGDLKPPNLGWLGEGDDRRVVAIDYDMNWNGCPHDRSGVRNALSREKTRVMRDVAE